MFIAPEPSRPEGILDVLNDRIVEAALGDRVCHRKAVNHAPAAAKHDLLIDYRMPDGSGQDCPALADGRIVDAQAWIRLPRNKALVRARGELIGIFDGADKQARLAVTCLEQIAVARGRTAPRYEHGGRIAHHKAEAVIAKLRPAEVFTLQQGVCRLGTQKGNEQKMNDPGQRRLRC